MSIKISRRFLSLVVALLLCVQFVPAGEPEVITPFGVCTGAPSDNCPG